MCSWKGLFQLPLKQLFSNRALQRTPRVLCCSLLLTGVEKGLADMLSGAVAAYGTEQVYFCFCVRFVVSVPGLLKKNIHITLLKKS